MDTTMYKSLTPPQSSSQLDTLMVRCHLGRCEWRSSLHGSGLTHACSMYRGRASTAVKTASPLYVLFPRCEPLSLKRPCWQKVGGSQTNLKVKHEYNRVKAVILVGGPVQGTQFNRRQVVVHLNMFFCLLVLAICSQRLANLPLGTRC
jgi:hypothetical protein